VGRESEADQIARVRKFKEERDERKVKEALLGLKSRAEAGEKENLIPFMIEAARSRATLAEVLGTVRVVMGECYDPFGMMSHPFI
jgi:methylmalonyl-CoA mutase N-terminal domain/subunit